MEAFVRRIADVVRKMTRFPDILFRMQSGFPALNTVIYTPREAA